MPSHPIVTPAFVRSMAAYNAEMNTRLYSAAARLSDAARRRDCGAFWHSVHGTFNHLLWADRVWMSRFDGWEKPMTASAESANLIASFEDLWDARKTADQKISAWAARIDDAWVAADQTWFSGAAGREITMPRSLLMMHFFNHQTHHRGQAHALLTAAGEKTGDTDLFLVPQAVVAALSD